MSITFATTPAILKIRAQSFQPQQRGRQTERSDHTASRLCGSPPLVSVQSSRTRNRRKQTPTCNDYIASVVNRWTWRPCGAPLRNKAHSSPTRIRRRQTVPPRRSVASCYCLPLPWGVCPHARSLGATFSTTWLPVETVCLRSLCHGLAQ